MILVETGQPSQSAFEAAMIFVSQLESAGIKAFLASETRPEISHAGPQYEALPYMRSTIDQEISHLIVLGADTPHEQKLAAIRKFQLAPSAKLILIGRFASRQAEISAATRYAYVTDKTPIVHNLDDIEGAVAGTHNMPSYGTALSAHNRAFGANKTPILVYAPNLEKTPGHRAIQMLNIASIFEPVVLTSGKSKSDWMEHQPLTTRIHGFAEMTPHVICRQSDIMVLTSAIGSNTRIQTAVNNQILSGGVVIDATGSGSLAQDNPSILRGPADFSYLAEYLRDMVLPNRTEIAAESQKSRYALGIDLMAALKDMRLTFPAKRKSQASKVKTKHKTVFLPTNGVGLGHAQRSSLIARELPSGTKGTSFLAFPSCLPMIKRFGFEATPLVQRSGEHHKSHDNDLVNYARMRAAIAPGDTLVFDGGYVFDSVYRSILNHELKAVWIRRGLWSAAQDNRIPLSRETVFDRVIVPCEAFDILNQKYSEGAHIHEVGPVVQKLAQPARRKKVRAALAKKLGVNFDKLVVTMLGGGVAADLSAHTQAVCNSVETRKDTLHLIVVWPSAKVQPVWYGWNNSRVVSTYHAGLLADACDMMVSAVGYNSFHEVLYNQIPCVFVPQIASYMDDQTARAEMASELGLAAFVEADRPGGLEREITRFLDRGKSETLREALADYELPEPGNAKAAQLIAELNT